MIHLATEIASENDLSLHTHEASVWTTSTYFLNDGKVQDFAYLEDAHTEKSAAVIAPLLLNGIIPENIRDISPKQLLKFRDKAEG